MSEQNTRNGNADVFKKAWRGFQGAKWTDEVNVREFIQNNYTQYDGTEDFLAYSPAQESPLYNTNQTHWNSDKIFR